MEKVIRDLVDSIKNLAQAVVALTRRIEALERKSGNQRP